MRQLFESLLFASFWFLFGFLVAALLAASGRDR